MKIYNPNTGWIYESNYELTPRMNLLPIHDAISGGKPSNEVSMKELEDSIEWYDKKIEELYNKEKTDKTEILLRILKTNNLILKAERTKRIKIIRNGR